MPLKASTEDFEGPEAGFLGKERKLYMIFLFI